MKFPEDENNNIKKFIERSLLERIKEQLKKILKWHKIYREYLSIFFPDFKLLSRRPGVLPQLHQRQILRTEKRAMPRKKNCQFYSLKLLNLVFRYNKLI